MLVRRLGGVVVLAMFLTVGFVVLKGCGGGGGSNPDPETNCTDTVDNDDDGATDCDDTDCTHDPACLTGSETNCADGLDNDGDGGTDCDDIDCVGDPACPDAVCPNGTCEVTEDNSNCPDDCYCGNGTCDPGEDAASCADDCQTGNCDSPEDLVTQSGCTDPEVCTVINEDIACGSAGSHAFYEDCNDQMGCVAGALCVGSTGAFECLPWCDNANPNCPDGGLCSVSINTNQGRAYLCSLPVDCNVLTGDGCTGGEACYWISQQGDKDCATPGTLGTGEACTFVNDCLAGYGCLGNPSECRELCDLANDQCSAGTCTAASLPDPAIGVCQ